MSTLPPLRAPEDPEPVDRVRTEMATVPVWRHRIPLAPGLVTAGTEDTVAELARLGPPAAINGLRVLDVGCSDGYYSFAFEQAGAVVDAVDDESSLLAGEERPNGFQLAAALRRSSVAYHLADAHHLRDAGVAGPYDVILFANVLYHLENPVAALRELRAVAADDALLIVKTYFRTDVRRWVRGRCLGFDVSRRPKWWFFPGTELGGDPTNWWAPNRAGLLALLSATGWEGHITGRWRDRLYVHARAR